MHLDDAITAHSQWRIRLQGVITGTSREVLDPQVVGADNKCILGQWIYGEARIHANLAEYERLVREHAVFHQCAAQVLRLASSGQKEAAALMVKSGDFHQASLRAITAIRQLRGKILPHSA
jgi:hypothetical protein